MPPVTIPRRKLLIGAAAAIALPPIQSLSAGLIVTPGQTEGPFYPVSFPADSDADLVRVKGQASEAIGKVTHVSGRILNRRGEIVPGASVEIWQCDANGVYDHPRADGRKRRDTAFQGYGRSEVDAEGRYHFRTIRPVAYPGRTPHIHFKVHAPGVGRLTTQMYVAGEPQNATDGVLNAIRDRAARESVIVALQETPDVEAGALGGTFDIILNV